MFKPEDLNNYIKKDSDGKYLDSKSNIASFVKNYDEDFIQDSVKLKKELHTEENTNKEINIDFAYDKNYGPLNELNTYEIELDDIIQKLNNLQNIVIPSLAYMKIYFNSYKDSIDKMNEFLSEDIKLFDAATIKSSYAYSYYTQVLKAYNLTAELTLSDDRLIFNKSIPYMLALLSILEESEIISNSKKNNKEVISNSFKRIAKSFIQKDYINVNSNAYDSRLKKDKKDFKDRIKNVKDAVITSESWNWVKEQLDSVNDPKKRKTKNKNLLIEREAKVLTSELLDLLCGLKERAIRDKVIIRHLQDLDESDTIDLSRIISKMENKSLITRMQK